MKKYLKANKKVQNPFSWWIIAASFLGLIAACTKTDTVQLSRNVIQITASAAPACGSSGARKLVNQQAAVETIRRGFDRYYIANLQSQNNLQVIGSHSSTHGNFYGGGFSGYTSTTPIVAGSRDAIVTVIMLNKNEPEANDALDARLILGKNWQQIVAKGSPDTCLP